MYLIKIALVTFLAVLADFMLWRKWREEYSDEDIFNTSLVVGTGAVLSGILASVAQNGRLEWGIAGWGIVLGGFGLMIWQSKLRKWDIWESLDSLTGILAWLWALTGWMEGLIPGLTAAAALLLVAGVRSQYRHWRWYKSGKMGLVTLVFLGWFGLGQITVAFLTPARIYWGGLDLRHWIFSYLIAFVIVAIYLRSGRKIKDDLSWMKINKNGKKQ